MKRLLTTFLCCFISTYLSAAAHSDTLVYDIKDTAKDKTLLLMEGAVHKNLADTAYDNMMRFQLIAGIELVVIIVLIVMVFRLRKRRRG